MGWVRLPQVVAHRGFHPDQNPYENTIEAFREAIDLGADRLELDVLRTRDGVLVVHHDLEVGGRLISETNYADLPSVGAGQAIPKLEQVAALAARRGAVLAVELKEEGYELATLDTLKARLPHSQFELISFNTPSIQVIERADSKVRTGVLAPRIWPWLRESKAWPLIAAVLDPFLLSLRRVEEAGADYVSIDRRSATNRLLNAARDRGIDVDVWTVNKPSEILRFVGDPRVHGIVTDRPDLALKLRGQTVLGAFELARQRQIDRIIANA